MNFIFGFPCITFKEPENNKHYWEGEKDEFLMMMHFHSISMQNLWKVISSNWPLSYLRESCISELISQIQISVIHSCNNSYSGIYQHKHDVIELKIRTIRFFFCQLSKKSERMGYIIQDANHVMIPPSLSAEGIRRTGTVVYAYNSCIYSSRRISVSKLVLTLQ